MSTRRDRRSRARSSRGAHATPGTHATRGTGAAKRPLYRTPAFLAVTVLAAALGIVLIVAGRADTTPAPLASRAPGLRAIGHTLGAEGAPVTVEVWSDYQCPYCRQFAEGAQRELIRTEVVQGTVRLVHRDFAFLGAESELAAQAADCAGEQDRYFDYHDKLFAEQRGENRGTFSKDALKRFATQLGLAPSFNACLDSGRYAADVKADRAAGSQKGVTATPTIFVNGKKYGGGTPAIAELRRFIDAAR